MFAALALLTRLLSHSEVRADPLQIQIPGQDQATNDVALVQTGMVRTLLMVTSMSPPTKTREWTGLARVPQTVTSGGLSVIKESMSMM